MLAGVGCKDYDDDINKINDRIDELTTDKIADIESQLSSMQTTVESLKALETRIKALEDAQVTDADLQTLRDAIDATRRTTRRKITFRPRSHRTLRPST